jgi:hypothetical protein
VANVLPEKLKWTEVMEKEFFERTALKLQEREKKNKELAGTLQNETCSFKPRIASHRGRDRNSMDSDEEDDDDGEARAIYQRFIRRVDEDIVQRRIKNPERFATKRVYDTSQFKV